MGFAESWVALLSAALSAFLVGMSFRVDLCMLERSFLRQQCCSLTLEESRRAVVRMSVEKHTASDCRWIWLDQVEGRSVVVLFCVSFLAATLPGQFDTPCGPGGAIVWLVREVSTTYGIVS